MNTYSFKPAYESLPANKQNEVRLKIMEALQLSLTAFYSRMRGDVEPKVSEAKSIETIFTEYGIDKVWTDN